MWNALIDAAAPPPLRIAALEFLRGEFGAALDAVRQAPPSAAQALLEARILFRLHRYQDVLTVIAATRTRGLLTEPKLAAVAAACEATMFAMLKRPDEARAALDALELPAPYEEPIATEIVVYAATCAWVLGEYDRTLAVLDTASTDDPESLARLEMIRGWARVSQGHPVEQFAATARAIAHLSRAQTPDTGFVATTLRLGAALSRDMADATMIPDIERFERSIAWTRWLTLEHFQVVRTLAWAHAMQGDYIRAIRDLSRAKALAQNAQSEMLSHLDHAWIAQISGEPLHMRAELLEADACAERVDWDAAADEEIGALLLAAELYASVDASAAQAYLDRANAMRERLAPWLGFAHDRRLEAFTAYAEACVHVAQGDRKTAIARAHAASEIFAGVSYAWRAANTALLLYRMGEGEAWLAPVALVAERYPRSFLATALERLRTEGISPADKLTRRQREIADAIGRGLRTEAIARELNMAPNTVRVHKNKIFKAYGVTSEFELLGRLREEVA